VAVFTVEELNPEASTTRAWPPRPNATTIAPASTLRCFSFRCGRIVSKNPASPSGDNSTPPDYTSRFNLWWTLSGAEDYYLRAGAGTSEAEGWWLGAQREFFGVGGGVVSEDQMAAFFGTKTDPATGEPLGSKFRVYATVAERLERAEVDHQAWVKEDLAVRAAALQAAGAGEERQAESLAAHQVAAEERWNKTRQKIETGWGAQQCGWI
jgi:hypothetical protein